MYQFGIRDLGAEEVYAYDGLAGCKRIDSDRAAQALNRLHCHSLFGLGMQCREQKRQ